MALGKQPIIFAAAEGDLAMVRLLLDRGADIESRAQDGATALHIACMISSTSLSKLLIERGAEINPQDNDGSTPLDYAQRGHHKNKDLLRLLKKNGAKSGQHH